MAEATQQERRRTEQHDSGLGLVSPDRSEVIRLEQVHRIYRSGDVEVHALRGLSLAIGRGKQVVKEGWATKRKKSKKSSKPEDAD